MLHFVYGTKNSDKSEYVAAKITEHLQNGDRVILLVPERRSVAMEKAMLSAVPDACKLGLEVLSFRRLCNRVFREYGGLHDHYISRGGKILLLWRVLRELSPSLSVYGNLDLGNRKVISSLLDTITTLDRAALSDEMLTLQAKRASASQNELLANKLNDLALIRGTFHTVLSKDFDDPEEDLDRLCHTLDAHPFFKDYTVFIDETASFSGKELAVIRRILAQSPCVTVALGKDPADSRAVLRKLNWCEKALKKEAAAVNCPVVTDAILPDNKQGAPALAFLRTHIFSENTETCPCCDGISLYACASRAEEAEMITVSILDHVQSGGRWRQHAIALRNLDEYRGILDRRLRSAGIPFYFADKRPLSGEPAVKSLLGALSCIVGGLRIKDISSYMKNGFTPLSFDEICLLEDYAKIWQIEGNRWKSSFTWHMNPKGRSIGTAPDQIETLEKLNDIKCRLMLPLEELAHDQQGEKTVKERALLLYRFYEKNEYPTRILAAAHEKNEHGDSAGALRLCQTGDLICDCLDELVSTVGDMPCTLTLFAEMLRSIVDEHQIGSIPQKNDEVLIVDVFSLGNAHYDRLYIPGLCDGSFPATGGADGLLTNAELKFLAEDGIDLSGTTDQRAADEFFAFEEAVGAASGHLTLCYPMRDATANGTSPSLFLSSVKALFPELNIKNYGDIPVFERLGSLHLLQKAYFSGNTGVYTPVFERVLGSSIAVPAYGGGIDEAYAASIYGDSMLLSQSKLEKFIDCPFAYACVYLFRLHEDVSADTAANEYGTLMHAVFEEVLKDISATCDPGSADDNTILTLIQEKINNFSKQILGENEDIRTAQLLRRAGATAFLLLTGMRDEFASSLFRPAFFELPFGMKSEEDDALTLPALSFLDEDGLKAGLRGLADRVDMYKKGDTVYFRIVDYKTGNKEFDRKELEKGLSGQMLLYMRAVCACRDPKFLKAIGADENTKLAPAGVVYCIAKRPQWQAGPRMDAEEILRTARCKITRNGISVDDPEILSALDTTPDKQYLPKGKGKAVSAQVFDQMLKDLPEVLGQVTKRLHAGCTDAEPLKEGSKHDACKFCAFRAVCRRKETSGKDGDDT